MITFDTHELAWAGGFFDGEGSVWGGLSACSNTTHGLSITSTDLDMLERFQRAVLGIGKIYTRKPSKSGKALWVYSTGKFEHIQAILCLLHKWLSPRRIEQFKTALTFHGVPTPEISEQRKARARAWYASLPPDHPRRKRIRSLGTS